MASSAAAQPAPPIEAVDDIPSCSPRGLSFERVFTRPDKDPFDALKWERRDAIITDAAGEHVFEQRGVEVPSSWSQQATNVVVSKYFRGALGSAERETSIRQLISRVVDTLTDWGRGDGFFLRDADAATFHAELSHVLLHQKASFNSPVWFNVGVEARPQCSACFINAIEDSMTSILDLAKTEAMLFKHGSGTGTNLSALRSSRESLSGGGMASGPVSFMKGFDAFAGVIKSGGRTRRAAKMAILNIDHPDILAFIRSKCDEEAKARALIEAGWPAGFDVAGGAYDSVFFQNANHTVRVDDAFMQAVEEDGEWTTRAVTDGRGMDTLPARTLWRGIAEAAWACGDPGVQYDGAINAWHTCPSSGRIVASNPCSEFLFLDDSACNLASINLTRFERRDDDTRGADSRGDDADRPTFDIAGFRHVCQLMISAQDLIVHHAGYPRPAIEHNAIRYRPLGLGYANLGALLMARGLPYDSAAGRALAAALTALLTGAAYAQSATIADALGPFDGFADNREPMLRVLDRHRKAVGEIDPDLLPSGLLEAATAIWDEACALGERHGLRNSQVTVLAPTGTIAFMMDCDTTGIEPDLGLIKVKRLVGGGTMRLVNRTVPSALDRLGYSADAAAAVLAHLEKVGTIEGAPSLRDEHLEVFDCAFQPIGGVRFLSAAAHLGMMAAVQPFLSGAISKTVNVPADTTVEAIEAIYLQGWHLGLKAVAVYRDGCKLSQPVVIRDGIIRDEVIRDGKTGKEVTRDRAPEAATARHRLPDERRAITHKFSINEHKGYLTVGLYDNGQPGEIFVVMAKEGSTISGLMDAFATSVSIALQYGVPLETLVNKFSHSRFEPSGFTKNPQIPHAKSIMDYIFRWLASKFLDREAQRAVGVILRDDQETSAPPSATTRGITLAFLNQQDAPPCHVCGLIMVRCGACYQCLGCGATSGCG